jgi:Mg2+ and Co2+ transporter CorA
VKQPKVLSLAKAAEIIGKDAQWLRRHLVKLERETGHKIMIRVGVGPKRTTYQVNMSVLRQYEPALFDKRDEIQVAIGKLLRSFQDTIERMSERIEQLECTLGHVHDEIRKGNRPSGREPAKKVYPRIPV